jgi:hypothetical protein
LTRYFIIPLLISLVASCVEDTNEEVDYNPNVLSSKDYVYSEDAILEVMNAFLKGFNDTNVVQNGYGYIDNCDVVYSPSLSRLSFGYGDVDRYCQDDKFRRGSFVVNFNGPMFDPGIIGTLQTDSLFVNSNLVDCTISIENLGTGDNGLPVYAVRVTSSLIQIPDTSTFRTTTLQTDYRMEWSQGSSTPAIHEDDIYRISGTASGISSYGQEYSLEITNLLENAVDCFWISQGNSRITVPGATIVDGDIDYIASDGCFNKVYFFFNENQFFDYIDIR